MTVVRELDQGSPTTSMDFHPIHPALILVGYELGDTRLWQIDSGKDCSIKFKDRDQHCPVSCVKWSPDGSLFGMAYSMPVLHLFSYSGVTVRRHREIHTRHSSITDFAYAYPRNQLLVITCGDGAVKFWDVATGVKLYDFKVDKSNSLLPDLKDNFHATPGIEINRDSSLLAVLTSDKNIQILASLDGIKLLRTEADPITFTENGETRELQDVKLTRFNGPCRSLALPSPVNINEILRLVYTNTGNSVVALARSGEHVVWKWPVIQRTATTNYAPQPRISMINLPANGAACLAITKNDSYLLSSSGGEVSIFSIVTLKRLKSLAHPPPAATYLVLHPEDSNLIAIGMEDSSIHIYHDPTEFKVKAKLVGHSKRITGLAFSAVLHLLVSSGANSQIIVWQCDTWTRHSSCFMRCPAWTTIWDTQVQFDRDQIRFLAIHESQLAVYDTNLERVKQWMVPELLARISHATFSCDSQLVYACLVDGFLMIFCASTLQPRCRINPIAYIPDYIRVRPVAIASNPKEANQFVVGLSEGRIFLLEPPAEGHWGMPPPVN